MNKLRERRPFDQHPCFHGKASARWGWIVIAAKAAEWGADIMNCMPLIPGHDTPFMNLATPTEAEMASIRKSISGHVPQIYHCHRCRADAAGLLDASDTVGAASEKNFFELNPCCL